MNDYYPIFFIVYQGDLNVEIFKLIIIDRDKCISIIDKYSELSHKNKDKDIIYYASGMFNLFLGEKDKWYKELIQKHLMIDLSNDIAFLEKLNNKNEINNIFHSRIYFIDFSDC